MPWLFITPIKNAVTKSPFPAVAGISVFKGLALCPLVIHYSSKSCPISNKYTLSIYFSSVTWDSQRPVCDRPMFYHNFPPII